jgi:hypothetical protein
MIIRLALAGFTMEDINIIVAGGIHVDNIIARLPIKDSPQMRQYAPDCLQYRCLGGAAYAAYLTAALVRDEEARNEKARVYLYSHPHAKYESTLNEFATPLSEDPTGARQPTDNEPSRYDEELISIASFPEKRGAKSDETVYRIDKIIGIVRSSHHNPAAKGFQEILARQSNNANELQEHWIKSCPKQGLPTIVVLIGDQSDFARDLHADFIAIAKHFKDPWLVFAPTVPGDNAALEALVSSHADKSTAIVTATALRIKGLDIRADKSLEFNARAFLAAKEKNDPFVSQLFQLKNLVVLFENIGVLRFEKTDSGANRVTISYCPFFNSTAESYPERYGRMFGYRTLLTATVVRSMVDALNDDKHHTNDAFCYLNDGLRAGVAFGKHHFRYGFAKQNLTVSIGMIPSVPRFLPVGSFLLKHPEELENASDEYRFTSVTINHPRSKAEDTGDRVWSLKTQLEECSPDGGSRWTLEHYAIGIVRHGLDQIAKRPVTESATLLRDGRLPTTAKRAKQRDAAPAHKIGRGYTQPPICFHTLNLETSKR